MSHDRHMIVQFMYQRSHDRHMISQFVYQKSHDCHMISLPVVLCVRGGCPEPRLSVVQSVVSHHVGVVHCHQSLQAGCQDKVRLCPASLPIRTRLNPVLLVQNNLPVRTHSDISHTQSSRPTRAHSAKVCEKNFHDTLKSAKFAKVFSYTVRSYS